MTFSYVNRLYNKIYELSLGNQVHINHNNARKYKNHFTIVCIINIHEYLTINHMLAVFPKMYLIIENILS